MIAAGLGCRKGCASADLVLALESALARAGRALHEVHSLYAPEFKADEGALTEIARQLGKPLVLLCMEQLQLQAAHALTQSESVAVRFGLPSIAETAALAGACVLGRTPPGATAQLLGPRQIAGGASCALAIAAVGRAQPTPGDGDAS
jgi:cobalt-precorrin 5A hydrolase